MADSSLLESQRQRSYFGVCHKTAKRFRIYSVQRLLDLKKARYIKIKAEANPYLPEYAGYYYNRRHHPAAKEFNYSTAREYRHKLLEKEVNTVGSPNKGRALKCLSRVRGNSHARFLRGNRGVSPVTYLVREANATYRSNPSNFQAQGKLHK